MPRPAVEDFLDSGRTRLGDYLEISELYFARRRFVGRILLSSVDQQLPASRYRHQDDSYRQEHQEHDRLQGDFRRPWAKYVSRAGQDHERRERSAKLFAVRFVIAGR